MLKQIVLGMVLLASLLAGTAWADEVLNKALFDAVQIGDKAKVEALLVKGADVNAKDNYGNTPLHRAANKDVAGLLISKGADVNAKEEYGGGTPLHWAASQGKTEVVELLISKGADVNAKSKYGKTPLTIAVDRGYKDVVELLQGKMAK